MQLLKVSIFETQDHPSVCQVLMTSPCDSDGHKMLIVLGEPLSLFVCEGAPITAMICSGDIQQLGQHSKRGDEKT